MIVRHSKEPLPKEWSGLKGADKALLITDIRLSKRSRLRMKLLVFRTKTQLQDFWKYNISFEKLGKDCVGAVNGLAYENLNIDTNKSIMVVDPNYFCVMGLVVSKIGMEIITHESVHAGINYVKRVKHRNLWKEVGQLDEEELCYPIGRIASHVNELLYESGMYDIYEKLRKKK